MKFADLLEKFNLETVCIEVENDLHDLFVENFKTPFEIGLFPEPNSECDEHFYVSVEIESTDTSLSKDQEKIISESINDSFFYLLRKYFNNDELNTIQQSFSGVRIFLNGSRLV